jgi:hypothetical protein
MALYRFFFAPVLLAVAVFAGRGREVSTPPPAAESLRAAPPLARPPPLPAAAAPTPAKAGMGRARTP